MSGLGFASAVSSAESSSSFGDVASDDMSSVADDGFEASPFSEEIDLLDCQMNLDVVPLVLPHSLPENCPMGGKGEVICRGHAAVIERRL